MVRWLHISDLHIKNKADWNSFKKELLRKCKEIGKINLVIVTGDFHDFGEGNNFEMSKSFLKELMQELHLDIRQDLFVIPGNHDGITEVTNKGLYINAVQNTPLNIREEWLDKLLDMFEAYETFVKELIPDYPEGHPARIHNREWRNKINFIHCNTAIVADGEEKINQLLDVDGLAAADYLDGCPNILLAHNNFEDLHVDVQKRVKDVIRNNTVRAYLCGDRHLQKVSMIPYEDKQNRQIPCVGCYKSAPDAKDHYSRFGIIVGEWQGERAELKGWCWESGKGFTIDDQITEQEIYMGSLKNTANSDVEKYEYKSEDTTYELESKQESGHRIREFITRYYNLSPYQIKQFNQKYGNIHGKLSAAESPQSLYHYVDEAEKMSVLKDMLNFIKSI